MRLNKLHIKGFKSFANETVINFNEKVIGIVGPNGAGKSNIVDAIRWVLGEQRSRDLRLEKMSDVIFSGTKKRRKSGVAQVTLSFENTKHILPSEYNAVSISRYLYQTGESEYRLNNVPCRLKDILSLFIDTGIGSNSYAIISLGMVDEILTDKDNSRRRMFEQAAGISKYKNRKKETLNKLSNTETDLNRAEDLLYEIEQNLKELEKQARRTKRFFEIRKEYKELSVRLADITIHKFTQRKEELQKQINREESLLNETSAMVHKQESELQKMKASNLSKEEKLTSFQRGLNELIQKIRKKEYDKELLHEKIGFNSTKLEELKSETEKFRKQADELQSHISKSTVWINELRNQQDKAKSEYDQAKVSFEEISSVFERSRELAESQSEFAERTESRIKKLEQEQAIAENNIQAFEEETGRLYNHRSTLKKETAVREERLKELNFRLEKNSEFLSQLEHAIRKREGRKNQIETEISDIQKELQATFRKSDSLEHERKLLTDMIENLEGYPDSIKYLIREKQTRLPLLADILQIDKEYKVVLENYLDPFLNYFIAPDIKNAADRVEWLNSSQRGKANFFVLSKFARKEQTVQGYDKGISLRFLVRTEPEYANLVDDLLWGAYIVDIPLNEIAMLNIPDNVVLLSRNGSFVKKENTISGGSVGLFEGTRIGRKKYLESVKAEIDKLTQIKNELESNLDKRKEELAILSSGDLIGEIENRKRDQLNYEKEQIGLNTELHSYSGQLSEIGLRLEKLDEQIEHAKNKIASTQHDLITIGEEIAKHKDSLEMDDTEYQSIAIKYSLASNLLNDSKINLIQKENELQNAEKDLAYREKRTKEVNDSIAENKKLISILEHQIAHQKREFLQMEESLIEAYEDQNQKNRNLSEAEQLFFRNRGEMVELEENVRDLNRKQGQQQSLITQLKEKLGETRYQINSLIERVRIEFKIDEYTPNPIEVLDENESDDLRARAERLKFRLENYGEINPLALEAYEEIQARYEDISNQKQDILNAKESLLQTIDEIEKSANLKFMEAFDKVRENFRNVFRNLFTDDDDCDLILTEDNDPLEAHIEIIAKPKGKRPRTLSQLSGGEKTLTAIALLFSLYLLKPAPFCIFDEVDAPLDDANILKFNKIIKKFSAESQFIIITHNKLTMAEVAILYGIYMQEEGVSQVSPVDLRNYEYEYAGEVK